VAALPNGWRAPLPKSANADSDLLPAFEVYKVVPSSITQQVAA
jgi:hypothetical protein